MPTKAIRERSWIAVCWKVIRNRVLEGMLIAAYAVGASEGYIYVRRSIRWPSKRLRNAIRQAERVGLLGSISAARASVFAWICD